MYYLRRLEGIMNGRNNQFIKDKTFTRFIRLPLYALLAFIAIMTGIQTGNFLYRLDIKVVEKIDSENFKKTINTSFPIIEATYNSGKSSTSFTREIKKLFTGIFNFDLDSPVTILNVESSMFMNYYNKEYKSMLALNEGNGPEKTEPAPDKTDDKQEGSTSDGNINDGTGKNGDQNAQNGNDIVGETDDNKNRTQDDGKDNGSSEGPKDDGDTTGNVNPPGNDLQPVSSITYEAEDDSEDDNTDMVALDKLVIKNFTKHKIDIAKLLKEPLEIDLSKKGPKVLIYHTHTTESYVLKEEDLGKKNVPSFSTNPQYSVVRVGEELARNLRKYDIETLHNGTVHDKVRDEAYGVAINTLKTYANSYPSIKVYIDIHRDAVSADKPKLRMVKKINGKNAAQIMFVVGTNDLLPHPNWEKNLKFALKVQQKLNEKYPGLARPVWIVGKRYNQHISENALLIEIGGDGNLLSECLESTKYLAEALNDVMRGR